MRVRVRIPLCCYGSLPHRPKRLRCATHGPRSRGLSAMEPIARFPGRPQSQLARTTVAEGGTRRARAQDEHSVHSVHPLKAGARGETGFLACAHARNTTTKLAGKGMSSEVRRNPTKTGCLNLPW